MRIISICLAGAIAGAAMVVIPTAATAEMKVSLLSPWNGKKVPKGQQCTLFGGKGSTPPMNVSGMPQGTVMIVVEYNDKSYQPLATKGGHGTIGYPVSGNKATLPAVPGLTNKFPGGIKVVKRARGRGEYASKGYLPPCSGGRGNKYSATVKAMSAAGKTLAKVTLSIGRY